MIIKIKDDLVNLDRVLYIDYTLSSGSDRSYYYICFHVDCNNSFKYGMYRSREEVKSIINKIGKAVENKIRYLEI